jgi:hypothetical protein
MATVGGEEENWLGTAATMAWSHADAATYLQWLSAAGFQTLWTQYVPEGVLCPRGGRRSLALVSETPAPAG